LNSYSDAFGWAMRDPQWISKVLLMGLISLIPIVGQIVLLGWMLAALDNLRAGRYELPGAGFSYIGRGFSLFVVQLLYGILIALVALVVFLIGGGLLAAGGNESSGGALATSLGGLIIAVGSLVTFALAVCYYLLMPVIILRTDLGGIGGGLNVTQLVRDAMKLLGPTLLAGLLTYVAFLIGSLGAILCGIGIVLTVAYGYAVVAGVVRYYEQQLSGQGPPSPQPPTVPNQPGYPTPPTSN
jgi:Protein of unknown function (DUF4013)